MNFSFPQSVHEYALVAAVGLPVLAIVAIELALRATGEKGSLLLPTLAPYPPVMGRSRQAAAMPRRVLQVRRSGAPERRNRLPVAA